MEIRATQAPPEGAPQAPLQGLQSLLTIAEHIGMPYTSVRKQAVRMALPISTQGQLAPAHACTLLAYYTQPRAGRSTATQAAAAQLLQHLQPGSTTPAAPTPAHSAAPPAIHVPPIPVQAIPVQPAPVQPAPVQPPAEQGTPLEPSPAPPLAPPLAPPSPQRRWRGAPPATPQPTPEAPAPTAAGPVVQAARSEAIAVVVLLAAIVWQVLNTAEVVGYLQSGAMHASWRAYLFAVPAQLTAFLMTIRQGSGKGYLHMFMVFEFAINMLHYRPWAQPSPELWAASVLMAFFGPFVIYSFGLLLANKK